MKGCLEQTISKSEADFMTCQIFLKSNEYTDIWSEQFTGRLPSIKYNVNHNNIWLWLYTHHSNSYTSGFVRVFSFFLFFYSLENIAS
jgi:hypothetical protein